MKKKELIGNFKDGGTDYRPKGNPQRVNAHEESFNSSLAGCRAAAPRSHPQNASTP
jgi:hypothetical protein